ncbi:hypothetical protein [Salinarimonas soli]|uniref:EthD domain-containing protein n=1 Tax=Salinarimonas soli TaxID=1638099 RepID=A0A5B2V7M4_9HYPH|nr:hypothetical protein [Salinarimonas soli]KAA2234585.1 hypothetical protein F0L46_23555 [Salinarimonas soli]
MTTPRSSTSVLVTYQGTSQTRFDRHYYVGHHPPLVMSAWHRYVLESLAAFFPAVTPSRTVTTSFPGVRA